MSRQRASWHFWQLKIGNTVVVTRHSHARQQFANVLEKIMRKLVVGGLITSASGNSGGFSLAREPEDITLLQIVSAVEGEIHTYPNNGLLDLVFSDFKPIATEGNSAINAAFDAADQLWRQALDKVTIYDLLCQTLGTVDVPKLTGTSCSFRRPNRQRPLLIKFGRISVP